MNKLFNLTYFGSISRIIVHGNAVPFRICALSLYILIRFLNLKITGLAKTRINVTQMVSVVILNVIVICQSHGPLSMASAAELVSKKGMQYFLFLLRIICRTGRGHNNPFCTVNALSLFNIQSLAPWPIHAKVRHAVGIKYVMSLHLIWFL